MQKLQHTAYEDLSEKVGVESRADDGRKRHATGHMGTQTVELGEGLAREMFTSEPQGPSALSLAQSLHTWDS